MIDRTTIERVLAAADIVEVVGEFVSLRRAGLNFKGLCPFHNERTPSFMVSPSRGICKCFSCGKGGNVVNFLMEIEQMTYPEAIRWLGRKYGIEVQERELTDDERARQSKREGLFALNDWAAAFFQDVLHNDADGVAVGKAYFRSRGFRDDVIKTFGLGFSPQKRDAMAQKAVQKGWTREALLETGLCYATERGELVDRYHGRVIFPVYNMAGKVVAFGGRILQTDKKLAKYVNSPESQIYSKSHELYGLYQAKQSIVREGCCYLVEGYTDVISMHQCGIKNVVASSGTSLTEGQIRLLHRFTENITVLYDGDAAGIKASLRALDMLLREGLKIKVLLLPDGDDPDSFARKHPAKEYAEYIASHGEDFIRFKTRVLLADAQGDPIRRAEVIQSIVESLSVIPSDIVRQVYLHESAGMLGVPEELLTKELTKRRILGQKDTASLPAQTGSASAPQNAANQTSQTAESQSQTPSGESGMQDASAPQPAPRLRALSLQPSQERMLITLVLRYGEKPLFGTTVAEYVQQELAADDLLLAEPLYALILQECVEKLSSPEAAGWQALPHFLTHPNPEISTLAAQVAMDPVPLSTSGEAIYGDESERLATLVPRLLLDVKYDVVRTRRKAILGQLAQTGISEEQSQKLMSEYAALLEIERMFAPLLGERVLSN